MDGSNAAWLHKAETRPEHIRCHLSDHQLPTRSRTASCGEGEGINDAYAKAQQAEILNTDHCIHPRDEGTAGDEAKDSRAAIDDLKIHVALEASRRHDAEEKVEDLVAEMQALKGRYNAEAAARSAAESNSKQYMNLFNEARTAWLNTQDIVVTKEKALAAAEERIAPEIDSSSIQARLEKAKEEKQQTREQALAIQQMMKGCLIGAPNLAGLGGIDNNGGRKSRRRSAEERVAEVLESFSLGSREISSRQEAPRSAVKPEAATVTATTKQQQEKKRPGPSPGIVEKGAGLASLAPPLILPRRVHQRIGGVGPEASDSEVIVEAEESALSPQDVNLSAATVVSTAPAGLVEKNGEVAQTVLPGPTLVGGIGSVRYCEDRLATVRVSGNEGHRKGKGLRAPPSLHVSPPGQNYKPNGAEVTNYSKKNPGPYGLSAREAQCFSRLQNTEWDHGTRCDVGKSNNLAGVTLEAQALLEGLESAEYREKMVTLQVKSASMVWVMDEEDFIPLHGNKVGAFYLCV